MSNKMILPGNSNNHFHFKKHALNFSLRSNPITNKKGRETIFLPFECLKVNKAEKSQKLTSLGSAGIIREIGFNFNADRSLIKALQPKDPGT